ncbi:HlyC/CorC family transporter [Tianweitania sediminis]|uniref:HlyC/CorC family transporter n=2 Tax=Tianweitania sediminis TaxID=1502156 RepID=A0A8J7R2Q3_9HYPH|nr:hemolysin family protein [Tianweitania sediminis]MBP0440522.1 HlyC/CorC family transporter [Tianweitania sediminis]HEV7415484.1 hemolysin family protein [Tianweitania sediminis]
MNDKDIAVAGHEPSSGSPDQKEDGPSSQAETTSLRRPLIDHIVSFFRPRNGTSSLREDLTDALAETEDETGDAAFTPLERAMLNNVLSLRDVRVEDVMVPRADIDGVDITTSLGDLLRAFQESGHSRMPVYSESLDDPRGMVHIRDVLNHITRAALATTVEPGAPTPSKTVEASYLGNLDLTRTIGEFDLIRSVLFVPPSMQASELMARMQASHTQMALVIDEYGGTDGLVSLEDIVEMIVGDIEDEHDDEEDAVQRLEDGIYIVNARADLEDVARAIPGFEAGELGEDVDTLSGLIFGAIGRVPVRGEVIHVIPEFEIQVLEADPRRVRKVRLVHQANGQILSGEPAIARSA